MVHARYPASAADYGYDASYAYDDVVPGERVGPPLPSRARRFVRLLLLLLVILGGGWFLLQHEEDVPRWTSAAMNVVAQLTAAMSSSAPAASAPPQAEQRLAPPPFVPVAARATPPAVEQAPPVAPIAFPPAAREPETPAPPPPSAIEASASPTAPVAAKDNSPEPLEHVKADPSDPLQVRAASVGLHPGLSRVLLEGLTAADFSNAAYAVQTALAQTPDSAVFTWPKKPASRQAVFKVHFVAGAASGCRRYVVTVIKDRWATTARPMEKCGLSSPGQSIVSARRPRQ
ncbi:MAG TPA: hypothetical protein VG900_11220 [Hyphomicrobiaceae bacterium]|jgi:hypothetical protein|nr:hypothetical protein [Hyphomicrobiaceae bacterium]